MTERHAHFCAQRNFIGEGTNLSVWGEKSFRSAVLELDRAIVLDNGSAQAWNLMGLCKTSLGEIDEGVASYKKALQKDPDHKEAWFNMFQALKEVLHG